MLKASIRLCEIKSPDTSTYRHFLTHISICRHVGQINIEMLPQRIKEALLKNHEVAIPCTDKNTLPKEIAMYCSEEYLYIRLTIENYF
ncbi:hypothetical protein QPL79_04305 [Ignisphaera sp. 4213-co]|uniref:Uncharacterized protein n=1 Tax=Ignisphaera cupida TaxID=3050454 RepID=A0ABD4Z6S2_9CREN|nr:hypothetical protein [Ignisphaera sp. 4213-co]MDK6028575.1 hypothetical protein [Ignisphaera sp. 4213-co]